MGGGVGTMWKANISSESDLIAFKIIKNEYDRISSYNQLQPEKSLIDHEIQSLLQLTYKHTLEELDLLVEECKCPAVILFKYIELMDIEQSDYIELITQAAITKEKDILKSKKSVKVEDYSKSFGGTEADSKNEKDAAELLRGLLHFIIACDSTYLLCILCVVCVVFVRNCRKSN